MKTKLIIYPQLSKCVFGDVNKGSDARVPVRAGGSVSSRGKKKGLKDSGEVGGRGMLAQTEMLARLFFCLFLNDPL